MRAKSHLFPPTRSQRRGLTAIKMPCRPKRHLWNVNMMSPKLKKMVNIISLAPKAKAPEIQRRYKVWIKIRFKLLRFNFNGQQFGIVWLAYIFSSLAEAQEHPN